MAGNKRARPWSRQPSACAGSATAAAATAAAAAAAFTLAALSVPGALSLQIRCPLPYAHHSEVAYSNSVERSTARSPGVVRRERHSSRSHHYRSSSGVGGSDGGTGGGTVVGCRRLACSVCEQASQQGEETAQHQVRHEAVPGSGAFAATATEDVAALPPEYTHQQQLHQQLQGKEKEEDKNGEQEDYGSTRDVDKRSGVVHDSAFVYRRNSKLDNTAAPAPDSRRAPPGRSSEHAFRGSYTSDTKRYTRLRDNDVRMFLLERGLRQGAVRKVLPVMRKDPSLMSDTGVLAARMQAIANLLESAAACYPLVEEGTRNGAPNEAQSEEILAGALATDVGVGDGLSAGSDALEQEVDGTYFLWGVEDSAGGGGCLDGGPGWDGLDDSVAREGARLQAYQLIASEPRLLLLEAEPTLASRLRFLLEFFPGLRGGNGRLRKAACLLVHTSEVLEGRLHALTELFPENVDVPAIVCQAPLLLGYSTETIAQAVAAVKRLVPGLRLDRVLRSAPQLLVQPTIVAQRRLAHLRVVLGLDPSPESEKVSIAEARSAAVGGGGVGGGGAGGSAADGRTLARFANVFPKILVMDPHAVRGKIDGLERLLPGLDSLAVVRSRPHLLGFDVRRNVSRKVSLLRQVLGPEVDLAVAVTRCPSLLTMSSSTAAGKLEKLQAALPSSLDARVIAAKEPRVLSLDMDSTVPRKMGDLARAFSVHAEADGAEIAAMMAQVLRYNPNALRYDPATLAGKLAVLREVGIPAKIVGTVVRDAPRCLSVGAKTLGDRVSTLKEAFPTIPVSSLLEQAPCLLLKNIRPAAQVALLRELFPSIDPLRLVKGAPMLLALSETTLRVKSDTWRHVLESRVDVPWEQAVAEFPQVLCQGLGRGARLAFLVPGPPSVVHNSSGEALGGSGGGGASSRSRATHNVSSGDGVIGARGVIKASDAYGVVCNRADEFARDHPAYPTFIDCLLAATRDGRGSGVGVPAGVVPPADGGVDLFGGQGVAASARPRAAAPVGLLASSSARDVVAGNRQEEEQRAGATGSSAMTLDATSSTRRSNRDEDTVLPSPTVGETSGLTGGRSSPSGLVQGVVVMCEKALGAAMTKVARESLGGGAGGREAAMLLLTRLHRHVDR